MSFGRLLKVPVLAWMLLNLIVPFGATYESQKDFGRG